MQQTFICGDPSLLAIKVKVLNVELNELSDCVYTLIIEDVEYGIYNETVLVSHDFIEGNHLRSTIDYILKGFQDEENIIDLTRVIEYMPIEDAIKQIIRSHYCYGLEDEPEMNYSKSIKEFMKKVIKTKDDSNTITFIMNDHDSMKDYILIPFFMLGELYLAIVKENYINYEDYDCSNEYDWKIESLVCQKIDKALFLKVLQCTKNLLSDCPVPSSQTIIPSKND